MCQALPAHVVRIEGDRAWVEGIAVGDYILHQAGLALGRVKPEDAAAIAEALGELDGLYEGEDRRDLQEALGLTTRARL